MSVIEPLPADLPPGVTLRKAREQAGLTLEAVAQRTLIPLSRLRALENDDYERVGVATFVIGYTRSYARYLGVDPVPLLQILEASLPRVESVPEPTAPVALALHVQRRPRSFFWPTVLAVVVVLGVIAAIGLNTASLVMPNTSAPASENTVTAEGRSLSLPLELNVTAEPATPAELLPLDTLEGEEAAPEATLNDTDFSASRLPAPAPQTRDAAAPGDSATPPDRLTLTFIADCWVSVSDATGKALIARLATSRDNLQLFGQAPFEVVLGDAAAVSITLNDHAIDVAPQAGRKSRRLTIAP